jgi:hypothetical protein
MFLVENMVLADSDPVAKLSLNLRPVDEKIKAFCKMHFLIIVSGSVLLQSRFMFTWFRLQLRAQIIVAASSPVALATTKILVHSKLNFQKNKQILILKKN